MQLPVLSRMLLCLQPSPNSKLSPIYGISLNLGTSLLLLPTTMPTFQVNKGCPTRNLQGWPLLCPPLQLMQRPGPHPLSVEVLSNLFPQSRLCQVVSFLLTPHRQWLSLHLQQGPVHPVPRLQGWPFSPYSHHISPLPTGLDHKHQHHHLHC